MLNLIVGFAIALKLKVQFELYIRYEDLQDLVGHLDPFARSAGGPSPSKVPKTTLTYVKNMLRVAEANPRRELKRAKRPVGNLPLEILSYIAAYVQTVNENEALQLATAKLANNLQSLDDSLVTADRIFNTPLPIAYTVVIS